MADNRADPKFRTFRVVTLAVYLTFSVGFSSLIIWSVFRSVIAMTPGAAAATNERLTEAECGAQLSTLFDELDGRRRHASVEPNASDSDLRWGHFRTDWLTRLKALQSRCEVNDPSRAKLKVAFERLDHLLDLYTVQAVQFAGEIGPSLDAAKTALGELSK